MNYKKIIFAINFIAVFCFLFNLNASTARAMTVSEIQVLTTQLEQKIVQFKQQLAGIQEGTTSWCHDFKVNIKWKDKEDEVMALQTALQKEGIYKEVVDSYFYISTLEAVMEFQKKYRDEISKYSGYQINATGFVGKGTRAKLNELYGCKAPCVQVITPAKNPQTGECKKFPTPCDVPTGWIKMDSCPTEAFFSVAPTSLVQGQVYKFWGKVIGAAPNSAVNFYLKSPDGTMQENGRYVGTTNSLGQLSVDTTQTIYKGAQTGTYIAWIVVGNILSNKVTIDVRPIVPQPSIVTTTANPDKPHLARDFSVQISENFDRNSKNSLVMIEDIHRQERLLIFNSKEVYPDQVLKFTIGGLSPDTEYEFKILVSGSGKYEFVKFKTAPAPSEEVKRVLMVIDADLNDSELESYYARYAQDLKVIDPNIEVEHYYISDDFESKKKLYNYLKDAYYTKNIYYLFFIGKNATMPTYIYHLDSDGSIVRQYSYQGLSFYTNILNNEYEESQDKYIKKFYVNDPIVNPDLQTRLQDGRFPEISFGAVVPTKNNFNERKTQIISYFKKLHAFRIGEFSFGHKILYSDTMNGNDYLTDEISKISRWKENVALDTTHEPSDAYHGDDPQWESAYLDALATQSFEMVWLNVHGAPTYHYFGVDYTDINSLPSLNSFFIVLHSCNNGNFLTENYMAGTYLMQGNVLAVEANMNVTFYAGGSIGGFSEYGFYNEIAKGKRLGDAIRQNGATFNEHMFFGDPLLGLDDFGVVSPPACTDSDGGKNYYTKGTTNDGITSGDDVCDFAILKERYCDAQSKFATESYVCPNGCENGACKQSTTNPSITVISPNGGETYKNDGSSITVNWQTNNVPSSQKLDVIRLRVYPNGQEYNLVYGVLNDGQEVITIPSSVPVGAYTLEIKTYINNVLVMDSSDNYFSIVSATTSCVDSDGGLDSYVKGTTCVGKNCKSDTCTDSNPNYNLIEYYCQSPYDRGDVTYKCPNGCENGACKKGTITVLSPNGGEIWPAGTTQTIKWTPSSSGTVRLEIRKGASPYVMISSCCVQDTGSYTWSVPTGFALANDYRVRVTKSDGAGPYDESDGSFSIVSGGLGMENIETQLASISNIISELIEKIKGLMGK